MRGFEQLNKVADELYPPSKDCVGEFATLSGFTIILSGAMGVQTTEWITRGSEITEPGVALGIAVTGLAAGASAFFWKRTWASSELE